MDTIDLNKAIEKFERVLEEKKSQEKKKEEEEEKGKVIIFDNDIPEEYEPNE